VGNAELFVPLDVVVDLESEELLRFLDESEVMLLSELDGGDFLLVGADIGDPILLMRVLP